MSCNFTASFELARNVTFAMFESISDSCPRTYLRPDPGGAKLPWLFALLLLFFHLPTCVLRAVKWESAQYLALGLAILGVALTVQAFVSTAAAAAEVLVWMPLTLVLDVGAMLQMVILIIEKHDKRIIRRGRNEDEGMFAGGGNRSDRVADSMTDFEMQVPRYVAADPRRAPVDFGHYPGALQYAFVALTSAILFLLLLVLQIYGLYAAVSGQHVKDLRVNWCSPAFRDFAVAVTTGNCEKYEIIPSSSNGIGCISLPGHQQRDWLVGTITVLSIALGCEVLDTILMLCTNSGSKFRGVKAQRPWLTMYGGVIVLVILVAFGVFNANHLPKEVTEAVWIYRKEESRALGRVCRGQLSPGGLRGMIIGYMDGLFESWKSAYQGV
ncbi:hypothetical protein EK21DRAFT_55852 [Setomelanomma holmii]|uniref:Uncharacterized protein n=1 Tax=Setomelanomma holmii TaxID=210430 RepID=A0A9P4HIH0_9PLEO|nr:hypothetical protein EK21DRAFT_55852 [Setomelanomma holmii]